MILVLSLVCGSVATAAALLAPARMQPTVTLSSGVSFSEMGLPIGHWIVMAAWLAMTWSRNTSVRAQVARWLFLGFTLHVLVLVALFVPRLDDQAAFSATIYLAYAHLFCAAVLAAATAWVILWYRAAASRAMDAVIVPGWLALATMAGVYRPLLAVAAISVGIVAAYSSGVMRGRVIPAVKGLAADDRVLMAVIFLGALAMRLLYVRRIMSDPNYLDAGADGRVYDELAWSIASGHGIPEGFSVRYPLLLLGHVWLMAGVYVIAGHRYFAITALQSVLGALACVLVYDVGRRLCGRAVALTAAAFATVSFPLIFAAATIGHQAWDVFMTALLIWWLTRIGTSASAWQWAAAGAIAGLAFTIRETNIFVVAFLCGWIVFANMRYRRPRFAGTLPFVSAAALVVLPFLAPKMMSPQARAGMREHFDRMYRGEGGSRPTERTELVGPLDRPGDALAQFRSAPTVVIRKLAHDYANNFAAQFLTQPYGGFDVVFLRKGSDYYYAMWFYAYALTIAGAVAMARWFGGAPFEAAAALLVLGLIVARTVPHLLLASDYRHRAPLEPFLILLASIAAVSIVRDAMATAASTSTSGFTGSDWRVSQSSGT